ncbi:MAG TPA: fatty acyl-AMP ligase [Pseudonocardia sp.]|uniref:fatty acyl-AMP ligase n=1 Tax=Pseudonocardia sp. TaxID=60912 RepID=UPI002CF469CB|nr:fatty acyl-AMP ligase [Pseudonocardia sp.]HTF52511.1 fatty acyl-AMP ligase [Pseudonocardia sp.]
MSRFLDLLLTSAAQSPRGMTTGEPREPVRRSWAQVHSTARRMAADLVDGGLRPGTSVAVLAGEPALIAPAAQAVWLAGGSVTMLHQPTPRTDLAEWAEDTVRVLGMIGAGMVLLGPPFDPLSDVLTQRGITVRPIAELGTAFSDTDADPPIPVLAEGNGEDDTALLQLTSGSTAEPKAVRITHGNLYANLTAMVTASELKVERDVMVSWLPLFHDMGMVGFLTVPMTVGLELVTVTPVDFLSRPLLWAELISKYGGTVTAAPNFAYAVLGRQLGRAEDGSLDLSSMRFALNGAEPIDPDAVASFTTAGARFGLRKECVVAAYGMAETALGVSFAPIETGLQVDTIDADQLEANRRAVVVDPEVEADRPVRRFPLLGPPLPGLAARVVDGQGRVLGEREVGSIQLRGEAVTPGYLTVHGPVATQDADGWLDTGDQGYLTGGIVVVCGRLKDVIIMGGRNIYPTDIERAAAEVDGVRAGNVVAVRLDAGSGVGSSKRESFVVVVESRRAGDAEAEQLIRKEVTARVVSSVGVRPARVVVLAPASLPKTPSGKLRRAATRELLDA